MEKGKFSAGKRKICLTCMLSLCLTLMQVAGWQISMKYGTSVHSSAFFQGIGVLEAWQCVLWGIGEFVLFGILIFKGFSWLEAGSSKIEGSPGGGRAPGLPKYFWPCAGALLFGIYLFFLIGCYPGFYNYDIGNQLPQVMYPEVPYDAHHPLLHTLLAGGIITLGYRIYPVDLTFGVFLYCFFQMAVCAVCFTYALRFLYLHTRRKVLLVLAFCFYAFCPPIVMLAMSTTKDILCYTFLLLAVLEIHGIYGEPGQEAGEKGRWLRAGVFLVLSCLLRNNIIYGVIAFAPCAVFLRKRDRKGQVLFYASVIAGYFLINHGLMAALHAPAGRVTEALSVPFQQIARLYQEEGEAAFTEEELELLYSGIEDSMLSGYDPFISDVIKYAFWRHLDTFLDRKWEFLGLWARKGLQYPGVYLNAFLDNTYQAWYPGTVLVETSGVKRYFMVTDWQEEYGRPQLPWLYDYYVGLSEEFSYAKYPVLRLFFCTGTMFWAALVAWFYGLWRRNRGIVASLGLVLWVCATSLCGPVSDIRYYLILFYMLPVCAGFLAGRKRQEEGEEG